MLKQQYAFEYSNNVYIQIFSYITHIVKDINYDKIDIFEWEKSVTKGLKSEVEGGGIPTCLGSSGRRGEVWCKEYPCSMSSCLPRWMASSASIQLFRLLLLVFFPILPLAQERYGWILVLPLSLMQYFGITEARV
jgi:hypothetical protein